MTMMQLSAPDLLQRLEALDERALTEVYEALSPALYRYACRLLDDPAEAEELVAETFHRLLLALRRGHGPTTHLSAYLYRVLHNAITDRFRRRPPAEQPLDEELAESASTDPALLGAAHLEQARARALLRRLTPEQRLVVTLKYFEGLSNDEIAAVLEKSVGTIKALQHRGLEALRRALVREGWRDEGAVVCEN
mgnify:CR=1 FL=1